MESVRITNSRATSLGKFIALVLRHKPDAAGLTLDAHGWADVDKLLVNPAMRMSMAELQYVVDKDSKGRYILSPDKKKIRANQGHSVEVDVELVETVPPMYLYHGTADKSVDVILREGLKPMSRQHVHLSDNLDTAKSVGSRHGKPVVLLVLAKDAYDTDGVKFFKSVNGVWLSGKISEDFISPLD